MLNLPSYMVITVDIGSTKIMIYPDANLVVFVFYLGRTCTLSIPEAIQVMQEIQKENRK